MTALGSRRVDRTGRSSGSRKTNRFTQLETPFAARPIRLLNSPAYRALSLSGHRALSRIEIEFAAHGGTSNGRLAVTYDDFGKYGIHRHAVAPAIRELVALGLIEVTEAGRAGNAEWRRPNFFRLTYRHIDNYKPTHEWERIETDQQAEDRARAARAKRKIQR